MKEGNKNSVVNFGAAGWGTIFYCMAMFWFYVGFVNDGSNITAPAVAEKLGVQSGTILNMNSIAGIVGVIFFIIIGQINRKIGARRTSGIFTIMAGIGYIVIGNAQVLQCTQLQCALLSAALCLQAISQAVL